MKTTRGFRAPFTMLALSAALAAAAPAGATHTLAAEHVPPPVAIGAEDLHLYLPVESSCIAHCGWIVATAHYFDPNSEETRVRAAIPHQQAAVLRLTIPGHHVRSYSYGPLGGFLYWMTVSQKDCAGPCHTSTVRLPSTGWHTIPVVGG